MGLLALLIAIVLEQARSPDQYVGLVQRVYAAMQGSLRWVERYLHAADDLRYGYAAWLVAALLWVGGAAWLWQLLSMLSVLLAAMFSVVVLYACLRLRHIGQNFTHLQVLLNQQQLESARRLLARWRHLATYQPYSAWTPSTEAQYASLGREQVLRFAIDHAMERVFHQGFVIIFWYLLLPGPCGAVLAVLSQAIVKRWTSPRYQDTVLASVAERCSDWVDYAPARLLILTFALMGRFDAVFEGQRLYAEEGLPWVQRVRLAAWSALSIPMHAPETHHLAAVLGLIWRSIAAWLGVVLLVTLAGWLG